ncbi:hypothetical protein NBO_65g0009, partial [Nosema bombycis CQ1]
MKEEILKDKNVLYNFVKSYFTGENRILYARVLQISQELAIEGELKSVRKHITKILIKYTRKRFKKFINKSVKRHKMSNEGSELVRSVVLEYVWFYRMTDILKKIFFRFNFSEFTDKFKETINKIVSINSDALVDELGKSIYKYEISKDDPLYAVMITETEELKLDSSKNQFSEMECIILILEIFKDIESGKEAYESLIDTYIENRYKDTAVVEYKRANIEKSILKLNEKLKTEINLEKRTFLSKILEKIQGLTKIKLYFKENVDIDAKFGETFGFWIETLTFKNSLSLNYEINKRFEKFVNEREDVIIKTLSKGIHDILIGQVDVLDLYRFVSNGEMINIENFINNEFNIFDKTDNNTELICCDLLCPISIVLNEFSVNYDDLEENDVLIFLRKSIFKFVGDVFSLFKDKDGFELALRKNLAERLFSESSSIDEEEEFLSYCIQNGNKIASNRLETMISDFKERFIYNNCEMVLLRKFQWPEYSITNLSIKGLDQEKKKFAERLLKNERKRLIWVDSLSSCDAEIDGKVFKISLIQYNILNNIMKTGKIEKDEVSEEHKSLYDLHFKELINKNLLIREKSTFKINTSCTENEFIPKKVVLKEQSYDQSLEDDRKFYSAQLDCKIMKICKKSKTIKIKALSVALKLEKNVLMKRLEELKKKGYLDVVGEDVLYIP